MKAKFSLLVALFALVMMNVSAQQSDTTNNFLQSTKKSNSSKSIDWTPRYKGEVNVGYAVAGKRFEFDYSYTDSDGEAEYEFDGKYQTVFSRPLFETVHGVEIGPYFFVGVGVGVQYYCGKLKDFQDYANIATEINKKKATQRWNAVMLPIFADIKLMYPLKSGLTPFLNLGLGGTIGCHSSLNFDIYENREGLTSRARGDFYCDFGAGLRYKRFQFSVGLQHQGFALSLKETEDYTGEYFSCEEKLSTKINAFYVKVGVNF